jgi:hypothetical protein
METEYMGTAGAECGGAHPDESQSPDRKERESTGVKYREKPRSGLAGWQATCLPRMAQEWREPAGQEITG